MDDLMVLVIGVLTTARYSKGPPMRADMGVKFSVFFIFLCARNANKLSCHGNDCDFKGDVLLRGSIQGRLEIKHGFC
ncbi:MAG: hypothetical protein HQ494_16355 [Rhodospirillales bacterium]|nr:hypothetical protein [Rhodospirillales bacterium]